MKICRYASTPILALMLLTGCAQVRIDSIPRDGYKGQMDQVYVYLSSGPTGYLSYVTAMGDALSSRLAARGIRAKTRVKDLLSINEKRQMKADLDTFKPAYLLTIDQTTTTTMNGRVDGADFDLELTPIGEEDPVWKAHLSCPGPSDSTAPHAADEILATLERDGLLNPRNPAR
jgi:hypothetical protein